MFIFLTKGHRRDLDTSLSEGEYDPQSTNETGSCSSQQPTELNHKRHL